MTTEYLLDTNACIAIRDLLSAKSLKSPERRRRIEQLKARWSAVPQEHLAMSAITLGELRFGAAKSNNPAGARARLDDLRRRIRVLPLDETVCDHYAEIRHTLESTGQAISSNDTWIAAHGRCSARTVVTANTREFARVEKLLVEDWTA